MEVMDEMPEPDEVPQKGLTRRDLLKRGAVVGVIAWSAPVVLSIRTPAFGATIHACCQCNQPYPWPALVNGVTCQDCQNFCNGHGGVKVYRRGSLCSAQNAICDNRPECPQDCTCRPQTSCP
jgi:hypothetical protein